ncbi:cyclopropane-fatty-acyl-phospholipid synthase family protein [Mesorhizobium sp. AR07]|uniref:SAM-dependent methyltransferase n=1 Tax=Mesorhizobium sp. AR07 TaxID=2865838 RepID=UPI002160E10F|nr:cyclopropane-fatty-acyl-phospholipid synthase family protein [Mesorhizobium sp. AR07]UVK46726.1 cyclopropane-fatty-acyl-phospholipid synthase family protein [Mesorhizobium sp. AR07]
MNVLLRHVLHSLVRKGNLRVIGPNGMMDSFGDGTGVPAYIHIKTLRAGRAITFDPMLALPEAYMRSEVDIPEGGILGLMRIVFQNIGNAGIDTAWTRAVDGVRHAFRRFQQINTTRRARRNVEVHYDLSVNLYRLFLDDDMQYSCAYFQRPEMTLDEAQSAKKRHIAAKLQLEPDLKVLDIGCGWGGLGIYLARSFNADVLGVTLSREQLAVATDRARSEGLASRVRFDVKDYRELGERFDRIVSVGMFEHVGVNHYNTFFGTCAKLLNPDGVILLHTVGRSGPPSVTSAFVRKYIFPGGYVPALSEVLPAIERAGLVVTDVEILRLHYADTLKHWGQRFAANRGKAKAIYDERFCRMWEFYLAASEAAFRWQDLVVFQIQLSRKTDTLPTTRDYVASGEKQLELHEMAHWRLR